MRFHGVVELNGKSATGIVVPEDVVTALGSGRRPAVSVTIRDYTYRTTIGSLGGRFLVSVSADVRKNAGVAAGDDVDVDLELDTAPREVTVPGDFAAALAEHVDAKRVFDKLPYSHQQQHVLAIEAAKKPETRQRRIGKAIEMLLR